MSTALILSRAARNQPGARDRCTLRLGRRRFVHIIHMHLTLLLLLLFTELSAPIALTMSQLHCLIDCLRLNYTYIYIYVLYYSSEAPVILRANHRPAPMLHTSTSPEGCYWRI